MKLNVKEILEDLMSEKNITLSELSRQLNLDYKMLSNYIKGKYSPNLKNAIILADYFNCSLDYFAGLVDSEVRCTYTMPDFNFYERYEKILEKRKLSHYRITKDININVNSPRYWREGAIPTFYNLVKIAEYLGTSIDSLIGREKINDKV